MSYSIKEIIEKQTKKVEEYNKQKVVLTEFFKAKYLETMKNSGTIQFFDAYSIVTNNKNLKIYIPNQWFYLAYLGAPLVKAIINLRETLKEKSKLNNKEFNEFVVYAKKHGKILNEETFNIMTEGMNANEKEEARVFLTDYTYWLGGKGLERGDYYRSSVLDLVQVVNVSADYIADIAKNLVYNFPDIGNNVEKYFILEDEIEEPVIIKDSEELFKEWIRNHKDNHTSLIRYVGTLNTFVRCVNEELIEKDYTPMDIWENPVKFATEFSLDDIIKIAQLLEHKSSFIPKTRSGSTLKTIYKVFLEWANNNEDELNKILYPKELINKTRQCIYFGAPGTGKSYQLNKESILFGDNVERVTFHPYTTYGDFVGTYKPVTVKTSLRDSYGNEVYDENKVKVLDEKITYKFVEGPLIKQLLHALLNPDEPYLLIIEELNRANVSAVFGDMFQLLDRNNMEESEYPINISVDLQKYIEELNVDNYEYLTQKIKNGLVFPSNLYIWASMNNADQGVMPLDTAFKRRWDYKYFGINNAFDKIEFSKYGKINLPNQKKVTWDNMRRFINDRLTSINVPEDRLLGPYFISKNLLEKSDVDVTNAFETKVLMYLFEDIGIHNRSKIFNVEYLRLSNILEEFRRKGEEIFYQCSELNSNIINPSPINGKDFKDENYSNE
ncbi:AAA family ATPase [Staphylococcus simulans]|uniref:AAA family ATPase n=1 Tax=Staphylococcus simulans TaxID=1286 RepID=UPI0021D1C505|nr:AAA family ATPase [Staphylococcus simulans]UXV37760.1 AAA family ATPase [Staphylococcus simulans]UXV40208.1 AAA family ATPase [Staphylococcus simulans]